MASAKLIKELAERGLSIDDLGNILNFQRSKGFTQENLPQFLEAIRNYTSGSGDYSLVNSVLRDSYDWSRYPEQLSRAQRMTSTMDEIMAQAPRLERDIVTFRGLPDSPEVQALSRLKPGEILMDRGYGSTSLSENIASQFAGMDRELDNPGVVLRIMNPAGSSGLFPYAFRRPHLITDAYDEMEYIVPRDTSYEVIDRDNNFLDIARRVKR